jgi:serine/threonine protein kinase
MKELSKYRVEKHLGSGAFGDVFVLQHIKKPNKKKVAKLIEKSNIRDRKLLDNEIEAMKTISKNRCMKHLICLDKVLETDKFLIIISEYIEGQELFDYIYKKDKVRYEEVKYIMYQLLKTLNYVHNTLNMAHLDIKPENIMINPKTKFVTIIDFGLSCTKDNCIKGGTRGYMSPQIKEIWNSPEILTLNSAKNADIFSLAIVFYNLLYCSSPFNNIDVLKLSFDETVNILVQSLDNPNKRCKLSHVSDEKIQNMNNIIREMLLQSLQNDKYKPLDNIYKNELFKSLKYSSEYLHNRFYKSKSFDNNIDELIEDMKNALAQSPKEGNITIV